MQGHIQYNGKEIEVRGGAWLDLMNSCFYDIIDRIDGYIICEECSSGKVFALPSLV